MPRLRRLASCCLSLVAACDAATQPDASNHEALAPELALVSNSWITRPDLTGPDRYYSASAVVANAAGEQLLYVFGGRAVDIGIIGTVKVYNPTTKTWTTKAPMPAALTQTNGAVTINGRIYISGGEQSGAEPFAKSLFIYDPAGDTWTRKHSMPERVFRGVSGAIGGKLYVLGCPNTDHCQFSDHLPLYRYDPSTDVWSFLSTTPIALGFPMGGVINGKLYVTGGPAGALLAYDPATKAWTQRAKLPWARDDAAAAVLGDKLYLMGGFEAAADHNYYQTRKTTVYDPATNAWSERALFPNPSFGLTASRITVGSIQRIAVIGGPRPNHLNYIP